MFIQALHKRLIPHPNNNGAVARFLFPRSPKPPPFLPQINRPFGTSSNNRKNIIQEDGLPVFPILETVGTTAHPGCLFLLFFRGVCVLVRQKNKRPVFGSFPFLFTSSIGGEKKRREFNSTSANIIAGRGKNLTLHGQYMFSCLGGKENSTFRISSLLRANVVRAGSPDF